VGLSGSTGEKKKERERGRGREEKALYLLDWHAARFSWRRDGCPLGSGSPSKRWRDDDAKVLQCITMVGFLSLCLVAMNE
jgi:hypothetical protein